MKFPDGSKLSTSTSAFKAFSVTSAFCFVVVEEFAKEVGNAIFVIDMAVSVVVFIVVDIFVVLGGSKTIIKLLIRFTMI